MTSGVVTGRLIGWLATAAKEAKSVCLILDKYHVGAVAAQLPPQRTFFRLLILPLFPHTLREYYMTIGTAMPSPS